MQPANMTNLTLRTKIMYQLSSSRSKTKSQVLQMHAQIILQSLLPNIFISNNLIKALSHAHLHLHSLKTYSHLHHSFSSTHQYLNNYTFPCILTSLSHLHHLTLGQAVHTQAIKTAHEHDLYVQNALLSLYSSCGQFSTCHYLFDKMSLRDAVSWTTLISAYRRIGRLNEALIAFERMQFAGVPPNPTTMVNALAACARFGTLDMGMWIHEFIRREGWELDVILGTSLINMYGKCGRIEDGLAVFESMAHKNVFTWNSVIIGLALAKNGEEAVSFFLRMEVEGFKVDKVTLIGVLLACSHAGLAQKGRSIFGALINREYGFLPGIKHYGCMIDLLGRLGFLEEALGLIERMPFKPNRVIWGSLLAGCRAYGDLKLSEYAARRLVELEPGNGAYYVLLSNIYAEMGRWTDVDEVRRLMQERGLKKDLGSSSVYLGESKEAAFRVLAP